MIRYSPNTHIFSLTSDGAGIAHKLLELMPTAVHHHGGDDFSNTARAVFSQGHDCIFICSTGIVIRTLAPLLVSKQQDPAVVVLDEHGKFVIPLISNHEGGAGALAHDISMALSAHCVVTSATDYGQPVYAIGMGCERNCPLESLSNLLDTALQKISRPVEITAIASIDIKSDEIALLELARQHALKLETYPSAMLRKFEDQLSEKSDIVFREVGCYGVAEAAALCAASTKTGQMAELVVAKIKVKGATAAIARSYIQ